MNDLLQNDRVRTLLREADDAHRLVERLGETGGDTAEVREALEGIWRDLGQHVHTIWRDLRAPVHTGTASPEGPPVTRTPSTDEDFDFGPGPDDQSEELGDEITDLPEVTAPPQGQGADEDLERWYTDEVDWDGPPEPIFSPGELDESLPATTELVSAAGRVVANESGIPDLRAEPAVAGAGPLTLPDDAPEWLNDLRELLEMLRPQDDPAATEAERLSVEASRVQWATTNMELRWAEFPEPVRVALVGLLASRARHLQERLEVDVGPRLALDRLQRYRKAAGLSPVVGLLPDHEPEAGSWTDDAERWWKALADALHTRASS